MGSFLSELSSGAVGGLLGGIGTLAKDIRQSITGEVSAEQKIVIQQKMMDLEIEVGKARSAMIVAEASSSDPWTSRARPSFMYVVYIMILASLPMGILTAIYPETSIAVTAGMKSWLAAIPDSMWTLFGVGYTGYAAARTFDKNNLKK